MAIRVVLADDHQMVLHGLKSLLSESAGFTVVGTANNGKEALALVQEVQPEVLVIDVTMPEVNGIDVLHQLKDLAPDTRAVALSMHASQQVILDMVRAGAMSYLLKSSSVEHLATAIRAAAEGETYFSPEVLELVSAEMLQQVVAGRHPLGDALSGREKEVLGLVAAGRSSREIADALFVSEKTIVWHRQSIMEKTGLRSVAELTKYAVRLGITTLDD